MKKNLNLPKACVDFMKSDGALTKSEEDLVIRARDCGSSTVAGKPAESENSRTFIDGSTRSDIRLRTALIGLGHYQPGWKWSTHAGAQTGKASANHIGYIVSGRMIVRDAAGIEREVGPGDAFEAGPGHDAWVVGQVPCVALDFAPIDRKR